MPLHSSPSVEHAYEQAETADEVGRLLDKLNPKPREALLLYYMADLSTNETARTLNVRVGTAKSRINRGLGVLKKLYEKLPEAQRKGSGHRASNY